MEDTETDSSSNLTERLRAGRQIHRAEHKAGDAAKLGNLRAGNSGIMSETAEVAGSCARIAHLRQLGVEVEVPEDPTLIMFQMGTVNEDVVHGDLTLTSAPGEILLRETEIPTHWLTGNGTAVTGRPDMVVCRRTPRGEVPSGSLSYEIPGEEQGPEVAVPTWGIELKSVASVWTTRSVLFLGKPKLAHLIQAAHYAWQLRVPFRLCYKQYANQAIPSWAGKHFPRRGAVHSEHLSYNESTGEIKNVKPFEIVYEIDFTKAGYLRYRREVMSAAQGDEDAGSWTKTLISKSDLERFYEFTSRMSETGDIGPRPLGIDALGNEESTSPCSYCTLSKICRAAEKEEKKAGKAQEKAGLPEEEQAKQRQLRYQDWLGKVRDHLHTAQTQTHKE